MSEEKHTPLNDTIHNLKVVREALEAEGLTVHVKLIDQAIEDLGATAPQAVRERQPDLMDSDRYSNIDIAKRMWETFNSCGDRWFKYAAQRLEASHTQASSAPTRAIASLTNHQVQCDEDGVMVKVSRQALDEVLAYVTLSASHSQGSASRAVPRPPLPQGDDHKKIAEDWYTWGFQAGFNAAALAPEVRCI